MNSAMIYQTAWVMRVLGIIFHNRHLFKYVLIGFASLLLEILFSTQVIPSAWSTEIRNSLGWSVSIIFASYCNIKWNFKLNRNILKRALFYFALISAFSLVLNQYTSQYLINRFDLSYPVLRLFTSGMLFMVAFTLHRLITFKGAAKNIGIAIYVNEGVEVEEVYSKIGRFCDHIHVDLIDISMNKSARPIDINKLNEIGTYWAGVETHMHVMSRTPLKWIKQSTHVVKTFIIHTDIDEDPWEIIQYCNLHDCKIGIVWRNRDKLKKIIPFLPHVDFVMILGISKLGLSGQSVNPDSFEMANVLGKLAQKYKFRTIFDGGVNHNNSDQLQTQYIVSSSAILHSDRPMFSAMLLKNGSKHNVR
jgi:ribulose-phosphate 3-epimerase